MVLWILTKDDLLSKGKICLPATNTPHPENGVGLWPIWTLEIEEWSVMSVLRWLVIAFCRSHYGEALLCFECEFVHCKHGGIYMKWTLQRYEKQKHTCSPNILTHRHIGSNFGAASTSSNWCQYLHSSRCLVGLIYIYIYICERTCKCFLWQWAIRKTFSATKWHLCHQSRANVASCRWDDGGDKYYLSC